MQLQYVKLKPSSVDAPSTHNVGISAEHFRQAAHDNIRPTSHLDVDEVSDRLVHND